MLSRFFIVRPIFAWVIAIVIMLAGILSILNLPIEQYPRIALPQVTITATYPGASAKTLEDSVTQVIEQSMTGLDHLKYMTSQSSSAGTATVTLDGTVSKVPAGEAIDIPLEGAHRIANEGTTDVVLIEVQRGTYFGEDDIVRLEDDYGRLDAGAEEAGKGTGGDGRDASS